MISGISSSSSLMTAIMSKLSQSQQSSSAKSLFNKADADGSGKVSVDELATLAPKDSNAPTAASIVASADTDGDSELTEDELAAYFAQMTSGGLSGGNNTQLASSRGEGNFLSKADTDSDGALSFDEFNAMKPSDVSDEQSQSLFSSADTDEDGSLSSEEVTAFEADKPQGGGGMRGAMMGPPPPPPSDEDDDEDDTTISGILSKLIDTLTSATSTEDTTETTATASTSTTDEEKIFNFFDQDGDGTVSEDELNTGVSAIKTAMASYLLSLQENRAAA